MNFAITIVSLARHTRLCDLPPLEFSYQELGGKVVWTIFGGGAKLLLIRYGDIDLSTEKIEVQEHDAKYMTSRVLAALTVSELGHCSPVDRVQVFLKDVQGEPFVFAPLEVGENRPSPEDASRKVADWLEAFSDHSFLFRAADDANTALRILDEGLLFVYRGFEWLKQGLGITWRNLGQATDIDQKDINGLKAYVNPDSGIRHASRSGTRRRYPPVDVLVGAHLLLHATRVARCRVDPSYVLDEEPSEEGTP